MSPNIDLKDVPSIICGAVRFEEFGMHFYGELARGLEDDKARKLFSFLASEEEDHQKTLREMRAKYVGKGYQEVDFRPEEIFSDPIELMKVGDHIGTVEFAIEMENRSIDLYKRGENISQRQDLKDIFQELVKFEQDHLELLEENLRLLKNEGSWYGYNPILD